MPSPKLWKTTIAFIIASCLSLLNAFQLPFVGSPSFANVETPNRNFLPRNSNNAILMAFGDDRREFLGHVAVGIISSVVLKTPRSCEAAVDGNSVLYDYGQKIKTFSQDISSSQEFDVLARLRSDLVMKDIIVETSKYISTLNAFEATDANKLTDKILRGMNRDFILMEETARKIPPETVGKARVKALKDPLSRFEASFRALVIALDPQNGEETIYTKKPLFQLCPNGYLLC